MQGARRAVATLALAILAAATVADPAAAAQRQPPPELAARAWVIVDAADGATLAARRPTGSFPVASTTKLMTAYVARRRLRLSQVVVAPAYAANPAESLLGLVAGERVEVRDLLFGLLLASGNDAAAALAQVAAGSEDRFVDRMNRAARRLGLDDTSYANSIGLDETGNFSSARDLVELAIELRADPVFRRIFDSPAATVTIGGEAREIENRNVLVHTVPYVNGVKTGYTLGAGNVLVASATRKRVTLVSAVLGAPSESERDAATLELLDYAFSLYERQTALRRGEPVASPSVRDQDRGLELRAAERVRLTVRDGQRLETTIDAPSEVEGPVERGERLGTAVITLDGETVARVGLEAASSVPAASLLQRFDGAVPGSRAVAWAVAVGVVAVLFVAGLLIHDRRRARRRIA